MKIFKFRKNDKLEEEWNRQSKKMQDLEILETLFFKGIISINEFYNESRRLAGLSPIEYREDE